MGSMGWVSNNWLDASLGKCFSVLLQRSTDFHNSLFRLSSLLHILDVGLQRTSSSSDSDRSQDNINTCLGRVALQNPLFSDSVRPLL